ncbi:MAG TPA: AMP-binding protein, partial [Halioglobus sp.]
MSISLFAEQLANRPDSLAITDLDTELSWRQLESRIHHVVRFLRDDIGLQPGEHIALVIGNRVEYVVVLLAGMLSGLWVTPVNTHLSPAEVDYIRRDCGAKVFFHDDDHAHLLHPDASCRYVNVGLLPPGIEGAPPWISLDSPAGGTMFYTSGTTGKPKGVKRAKPATVGEMIERLRGLGQVFGLTGRGPHLVTGPLYHAAPGLFALYDMLHGAPMVILPRWDTERFLQCVQDYRIVTTHLVPTMFVRLLEWHESGNADTDLSSLRYVLHGAAPITPSVKQHMIDWWGPILTEYWGATESGIITLVDSETWATHPGTVGRPIPNYHVFVGDREGNPSAEPEGMLFCRHQTLEQVFSYHHDPEKTAKAHPQPHVFCICDLGRVDADGFIYLSDRESHMIISGGVNIYPSEVELVLLEHDDVVDTAVFGIPNAEWGEEVKAVVQLRKGLTPSPDLEQQLRDFTRGKIAGFKVPRSIAFVQELPRNP